MKKILILIIIFCSIKSLAQDVIYKKNGDELLAEVREVTSDSVIFRKFNENDLSRYTVARKELFMIKYQDGRKQLFPSIEPDKLEVNNSELSMSEVESDFLNQKITIQEDMFIIGSYPFSHNKFLKLLSKETDPAVVNQYNAYKEYTKMTRICAFGSIPFGVAAHAFLQAGISTPRTYDGYNPSPYRQIYFTGAITSSVIFVGLQTARIVLTKVHRRTFLKKAVEAHNKRLSF